MGQDLLVIFHCALMDLLDLKSVVLDEEFGVETPWHVCG